MEAQETSRRHAGLPRRALDDLPGLLSLLVFCGVTAVAFRSWEFALIVTASLGFHELGHAAAIAWYGMEWRISFGLFGAWTWSPEAQRARLSHLSNAVIHLAGPCFSLLFALLVLVLNRLWMPHDAHLLILANFSAQLGLLNLLPLGEFTDGGKIVRRIIASLDGLPRILAQALPISLSALALFLYVLALLPREPGSHPRLFLISLLLIGTWLADSMLLEARRARPLDASAPMRPGQVYLLTMAVWGLLAAGLTLSSVTPFWLAPRYVLGSLQNVVAMLRMVRGG